MTNCFKKCVVPSCERTDMDFVTKFHSFPKDDKFFKLWMENLRIDKKSVNNSYKKVCSKHFEPACFGDSRLRVGAVPTINLGHTPFHKSRLKLRARNRMCNISSCPNTTRNITLFSVPKNEPFRSIWYEFANINISDKPNIRICASHFEPVYIKGRYLAKDAIPTIIEQFKTPSDEVLNIENLEECTDTEDSCISMKTQTTAESLELLEVRNTADAMQTQLDEVNSEIPTILEEFPTPISLSIGDLNTSDEDLTTEELEICSDNEEGGCSNEYGLQDQKIVFEPSEGGGCPNEYELQEPKIKFGPQEKYNYLRSVKERILRQKISNVQKTIVTLQAKIVALEKMQQSVQEKNAFAENNKRNSYANTFANMITGDRVLYTEEEKLIAKVMSNISPKAYNLMKERLGFNLPSLRSMQMWQPKKRPSSDVERDADALATHNSPPVNELETEKF